MLHTENPLSLAVPLTLTTEGRVRGTASSEESKVDRETTHVSSQVSLKTLRDLLTKTPSS